MNWRIGFMARLAVVAAGAALLSAGSATESRLRDGRSHVTRAADVPTPSVNARTGVRWYREIKYAGAASTNSERQVLDLYLPNEDSWMDGRPLLIWIHGGGWIMGDKDDAMGIYGRYCRKLAEHGIAAANVTYRLSPEVRHPGHIEDIACATAWLLDHAEVMGYDASNVFVSGHSAGGHLAALLAVDDRWLQAAEGTPESIRGAIPSSGVYDLEPMFKGRIAFGGAFPPGTAEDASPISHVDSSDPPFLLFVEAHGHFMHHQARVMMNTLERSSVSAALVEVPRSNHITMLSDLALDDGLTLSKTIEFVKSVLCASTQVDASETTD